MRDYEPKKMKQVHFTGIRRVLEKANIVKPGGIILVNADMVEEADLNATRKDVKVVPVHCDTLADQVKNPKGANIVMIGAIAKLLGDFDHETGVEGMNDMFRKKGKNKYEALNAAAFEVGYYAV